jgi:hypothetical protein
MAEQTELLSQWFRTFDGANADVDAFYGTIEKAVGSRGVPDVKFSRPHFKEGGMLSASREYLRIERGDLRYEVGAAPFGKSFFVSARLFAQGKLVDTMVGDMKGSGMLGQVTGLLTSKVLGVDTYYKLDTAQAFLQLTHSALMEAVDAITTSAKLPTLSESERRPILKGFFQ